MNPLQSYIFNDLESYREFFDNVHDLVHIVEPDGKIVYVNNSWKRLLGYTLEEIRDKSIYSLVDPADRDRFIRYREQIVNGNGGYQEIIIALKSKSGEKIYVEGFVSPRTVNGKTIYTNGIFRDITARLRNEMQLKQVNAELKEREANLQRLLFNAPDAVIVIDTESNITYWNPKAEMIFGWSHREVIGKPLTQLIIPEKYKHVHEAGMKRYLETGEANVLGRTIEITAVNKHKKEFYVSLTISTTYQKGQVAFIAFIRDIDDEKRIQRELDQNRAQLEASNKELEQFAYVASHDMKEPVRKIRMFLERLRTEHAGNLLPNAETYINKIDGAASRLVEIVDGVLAYSSLKSEKAIIEDVDLTQIIRNVQKDLDIILEEKGGEIKCARLPTIEGSRFLLYQLFYNLINNSLKFSRPGVSPVIEITANKDVRSSFVRITVKDNGIGFPQEYAEKIFDSFTRLNPKTQFEGTGLGLSICKTIVEKHNGSITAYGKENSGATFIIQLPESQSEKKDIELR